MNIVKVHLGEIFVILGRKDYLLLYSQYWLFKSSWSFPFWMNK